MEFIFSFVQRTMLKTLVHVYPTSVQELVNRYHCVMLACNAAAVYADAACESRTAIPMCQFRHRCRID